jgi:assimilatory nitrate reductase catalytic subunit
VAEEADERYPLRLITGRLRDQWHTMSRTGTIAGLFAHEPEPRLMVHPDDLSRLGLKKAELLKVASRRGHVYVEADADPDMPRGVVFLAMHWGARFLAGEGRRGVNELTIGALDPSSRQPELKHCAVRVEAAQLPWRLVAFGHAPNLSSLMEELAPVMSAVPYATRTLIGRERPGVRLSLAAKEAPGEDLLRRIDTAFGLDATGALRYEDGTVRAARLSGDIRSERWLKDLWELEMPRGRTVCNCFDVAQRDIDAFLAASKSLAALQASLKCGTNCGSCLPELRRMAAAA